MTPSKVSPVVTKRQSAIISLRAKATIIVLRVPRRLSAVRARYHRASASFDSPLEGAGFEPSVPRGCARRVVCRFSCAPTFSVGGELRRGDIQRLVVSPRDRWFESGFLQRGV